MTYTSEFEKWLKSEYVTEEERAELHSIENNDEAKKMRFSAPMDFGTAGLRSTMHMGIGCMNRFTVAQTTRGIAALIKAEGGERRGVAIAYDSRNNSRNFAEVSASVLAGAGIKVYIFDDLRPTPELSFAVRQLNAIAGINITASHNPKEYNGYKAYWEDGAQIGPEQAAVVSAERAKFDALDLSEMADFDKAVKDGTITVLTRDFDELYLKEVIATAVNPELVKEAADELKVVYTPLHGAGTRLVPEVFKSVGLKHLYTVKSQMQPDGDFPTVAKPNPEYPAVFEDGIKIADNVGSDLIIATDPDADRVGVMARGSDGKFKTITGNQMGALLLDYVIKQRKLKGELSADDYCVKSLVSTDMAYKIAEANGVKLYDVLTGFKFIGEVIKNYEKNSTPGKFLLGFEESYGYLLGTYARDKDAVEASMMILEMTAFYKKQGKTLIDALDALYSEYGYYSEGMIDIYMEGLDGIEKRKKVMSSLRSQAPRALGGIQVFEVGDYKKGTFKNLKTGEERTTAQPSSDVLYFILENDDKIIVRLSGTEPKIKIYILAHGEDKEALTKKIEGYAVDARKATEV